MSSLRWVILVLAALAVPLSASADPIHAQADGGHWHHDSGWIFPAHVGEFQRVGAAQDVAGTRDAVAWYAREVGGARVTASVEVFPADSAAGSPSLDAARAALLADGRFLESELTQDTLALSPHLRADRLRLPAHADHDALTLYFVSRGEWRVRIRILCPGGAGSLAEFDSFVQAQRWDALP